MSSVNNILRLAVVVFGWAAWPLGLSAAEKAKPATAAEAPVTMSPFEVNAESVEFRSWIKLSSPHYLLYTDANEKEALTALRELEKVELVGQTYFRRRTLNLPPVIIVLPTSRSDWRKIEAKGGVEWQVAVSQPGRSLVDLVLVQYDWQNSGLGIVRAVQGHAMADRMSLRGPFWFSRGIGSFFETVEFSGDTILLGRQNSRTHRLIEEKWIEWPRFFSLTGNSPEFTKEKTVNTVEGQAAIFAHYMLANPDPVWVDRMMQWNEELRAGRDPGEADFKAIFGQDWKTWQRTMIDYLRSGKYNVRSLQVPKGAFDFAVGRHDLPVREMRELFVLAQVLNQHVPASEQALDSILAKGLRSEALREILVEACLHHDRRDVAREQLARLQELHSSNPKVYSLPAQMLFRGKIAVISTQARLTAEESGEIRALCKKALEIEPLYAPAWETLVWAEALAPKVDASTIAELERAYRTLQGYTSTSDAVAALGVVAWRTGDKAWALKIAQALADSPYADRDGKRIARELLKELGAPVPGATP